MSQITDKRCHIKIFFNNNRNGSNNNNNNNYNNSNNNIIIRRFSYDVVDGHRCSWSEFNSSLKCLFKVELQSCNYRVSYRDNEGDSVLLDTEKEWMEMLSVLGEQPVYKVNVSIVNEEEKADDKTKNDKTQQPPHSHQFPSIFPGPPSQYPFHYLPCPPPDMASFTPYHTAPFPPFPHPFMQFTYPFTSFDDTQHQSQTQDVPSHTPNPTTQHPTCSFTDGEVETETETETDVNVNVDVNVDVGEDSLAEERRTQEEDSDSEEEEEEDWTIEQLREMQKAREHAKRSRMSESREQEQRLLKEVLKTREEATQKLVEVKLNELKKKYVTQLRLLNDMGYDDIQKNLQLMVAFEGDVRQVLEALLSN